MAAKSPCTPGRSPDHQRSLELDKRFPANGKHHPDREGNRRVWPHPPGAHPSSSSDRRSHPRRFPGRRRRQSLRVLGWVLHQHG